MSAAAAPATGTTVPADWTAAEGKTLLQPLKLGAVTTANRIIMAPMTRIKATEDHVPTPIMAEYYSQRASAGLIISEATIVAPNGCVFYKEAGLYTAEHVKGWKPVTDAVHAKGGRIFVQLYHGGRTAIAANNGGQQPFGPSAIQVTLPPQNSEHFNAKGEKTTYEVPRELTDAEIRSLVTAHVHSAKLAIEAGFDGVELHAANGYLIDQFLRDGSNKRSAPYGGSIENRARFLLEIVDGIAAAIGAGRVGVRISPLNSYQSGQDSDPAALTAYVSAELSKRKIAFLHLIRMDFFQIQKGDVWTIARKEFAGPLLINGGFSISEAAKAITDKTADAVVFGAKFLANPDLPKRIQVVAHLNVQNPAPGNSSPADGYTDYPFLA